MTTERESALSEFECRRVTGGVWVRIVLAGVGASGVISCDDARNIAAELIAAVRQVPPRPKEGVRHD